MDLIFAIHNTQINRIHRIVDTSSVDFLMISHCHLYRWACAIVFIFLIGAVTAS